MIAVLLGIVLSLSSLIIGGHDHSHSEHDHHNHESHHEH